MSTLDEVNAMGTSSVQNVQMCIRDRDETIIAKTRTDEIIEFLEKVICERCGMNLKIFPPVSYTHLLQTDSVICLLRRQQQSERSYLCADSQR